MGRHTNSFNLFVVIVGAFLVVWGSNVLLQASYWFNVIYGIGCLILGIIMIIGSILGIP